MMNLLMEISGQFRSTLWAQNLAKLHSVLPTARKQVRIRIQAPRRGPAVLLRRTTLLARMSYTPRPCWS